MGKVTYIGNDLAREVPKMEKPMPPELKNDHFLMLGPIRVYELKMEAYEQHLASLQTFPVLTPHNWIEGQTYEEGRDYERTSSVMFEHEGEKVYDWDTVLQPIANEAQKVLIYGEGFKIEQKRRFVEYFIWNCPHCTELHKTSEYAAIDGKLFCSSCLKYTSYAWK